MFVLLVLAISVFRLVAAEPTSSDPSVYDRIWSYTDLYHDANNPVVQMFRFTGRFQLDYALLGSDQGSHNEWNIRRFRLGAEARVFEDITLHGEVDLNPQEADPLLLRLTDMYAAWSRNDSFRLTVGKHSAPFTMDGSTSSRELLTIDRNNLANNLWFPQEYFLGVSVSGKPGAWRYWAGVYSSGAANREFGEFNGGVFLLGTLGYDFGRALRVHQALLALNYVYNEPDRDNTFTRNLQHIGSLNFTLEQGRWGVRTDLAAGTGYLGQSDLWGAMIMPYYNLTHKLQIVGRYTWVESSSANGVRLNLYENTVTPGRGDQYDEVYLGLNYFFYGHKLKVQTGVQYVEMRDRANDGGDHHGWSWTTGLRVSW